MRREFFVELYNHMKDNPLIWALTGDLGYGGFDRIQRDFPDRFINVGAAEQTMLDMAVGLAYEGKIPVVYSITPFLLYRGFETIRTYINHEKLNIKLIGSGRDDDYKHDGWSHNASDDWMVFENEPGTEKAALYNVVPLWPNDTEEMKAFLNTMFRTEGPYYLNLKR